MVYAHVSKLGTGTVLNGIAKLKRPTLADGVNEDA